MIHHFKKYAAVMAYFFVFGLLALVTHHAQNIQPLLQNYNSNSTNSSIKNETNGGIKMYSNANIIKRIAQSSVSILCISFYVFCYVFSKTALWRIHLFIHKMLGKDYHTMVPEEVGAAAIPEISSKKHNLHLHHYVYLLWFSIFCASYSIDATNLNAAFFFSIASGVASCSCFLKKEYLKKNDVDDATAKTGSLIYLITICVLIIYFVCFASWAFIFYCGETTISLNAETSLRTRYMWLEVICPSLAPFIISSIKTKSSSSQYQYGGDIHVLFAAPFLAFVAILFLTMYLTFAGDNVKDIVDLQDGFIFIILRFIVIPLILFIALVIYVGAMGQTEYCMISSSSLCLIFFLYSNWNLPMELKNKNNIIIPCCTMSLIGFLLCLSIIIFNAYRKDLQRDIKHPKEDSVLTFGCEYYFYTDDV